MPAYRPPPPERLPVDLNAGYPDSYVKKPEGDGESTPVEVIIQGARHAGLDARTVQVVTFRFVGGGMGGACRGGQDGARYVHLHALRAVTHFHYLIYTFTVAHSAWLMPIGEGEWDYGRGAE